MDASWTLNAVACTQCGCVCDDLRLTIAADRIIAAERACSLAEPWFLSRNTTSEPAALLKGKPADLDAALRHAAELLAASRSPLIYGLSRSTTEGQRAAIALADRLGATIDTTAATGHAASLIALQQVGESTCSLGEVRNRADLVIYWASDPLTTHPRHMERVVDAPGMFVPAGRADRFVVFADQTRTPSSERGDLFIPIPPDGDWEALWTLRALIAGLDVPASPALHLLAERMRRCRFGIIFFGVALTRGALGHRNVEALLRLTTDLNRYTRFYARRMRRLGDVAGADSVLTWQTGFPFAVNLAPGRPRYNPGEFSGPAMLERREVDLCLFVGSESAADFSPQARTALSEIPVIALDSPGLTNLPEATVRFTTAVYGIHKPGTAYRMDEIPIPLRVVLPTEYPSDGEILTRLLDLCADVGPRP